eukprot:12399832-Karenia_brevis.AAC.1
MSIGLQGSCNSPCRSNIEKVRIWFKSRSGSISASLQAPRRRRCRANVMLSASAISLGTLDNT